MRQIFLLLVPAAAATLALSEPITRLIYEHGRFGQSSTDLVSSALFWFAFSLPFSGVNLLLTRTFFSLQKPWITTGIAGLNLTVNVAVSVALYKPFGIAGIVIGTGVSSAVMTVAQMYFLRRELHGRLDVKPHADRRHPGHLRRRAAGRRLVRHVVRARPGARRGPARAAPHRRLRAGGRLGGLRASPCDCWAYRRRAKSRVSSGNGLLGAANGRKQPLNG